MSDMFLLFYILNLKKALLKLGKMFFISLQKLFPFLRYSSIRILEPEISRHHQMPKYETNIFYCKIW